MRLRIAKKICNAIGTPRDSAYTGWQKLRAVNRIDRTRSAKLAEAVWHSLMYMLGPEGRRKLAQSIRDEL